MKRLEAIVAQQREEIARLTAENTRLRTGAGETGAAEAASASGTGSVDLPGRHGSVTSMRDRFDSSNSVASAGSGISNTSSHDNSRGGSQASIYTSNYEASNIDVFYKLHQLQVIKLGKSSLFPSLPPPCFFPICPRLQTRHYHRRRHRAAPLTHATHAHHMHSTAIPERRGRG